VSALALVLALSPVIVVLLLLLIRKTPADLAGLAGWGTTLLVAWLYFRTSLNVLVGASAAGVVASFPITLMVGASIYQVTVMLETKAIARVVAAIKTVSPADKIVQIMIINVGFGTILAALGATPVSILPPIMVALGYSTTVAIALPAIGYDALCTYALLGIPVIIFANFFGKPLNEVGGSFARFMPVITTCIALGMLWIVGKGKMVVRGLPAAILAGVTAGFVAIGMNAANLIPLTGIASGLAVIAVMILMLALRGRKIVDRAVLAPSDVEIERTFPLWKALAPWWIMTLLALIVNAPFLPFFKLTFTTWAMPLEIIPGAPEKVRLLFQAYFWILVSTFLALPFLRPAKGVMAVSWRKWLKRAPRPMLASAAFFAVAYLINHSGKGADWQLIDAGRNMVNVVAQAAAAGFRRLYPLVAPFLGLLAGFISGSESSAIAMLTKIHLVTSEKIQALGILVAAASGIGGGLASVISPAKLQNASASIDKIGEEAKVIPTVMAVALAITAVAALLALFWAF
jgi:lactate permease